MDELKKLIREVPDFPKPGILFYDITTVLKDKTGFRKIIDQMTERIRPFGADIVLGIEARGFIFAPALAYNLGAGFVPVRKPKKLPAATERISYELEYGVDTLEIHRDAVKPGMNVVVADDLLATGGTSLATVRLAEKLGGNVAVVSFVIELEALRGRDRLNGYEVVSLLKY
jgi:adenine phosphoribosyltransferase